ncbi:MAG: hypothetical protein AABZ57_01895 [Candidatus Margulisiibacteriota bacterium]
MDGRKTFLKVDSRGNASIRLMEYDLTRPFVPLYKNPLTVGQLFPDSGSGAFINFLIKLRFYLSDEHYQSLTLNTWREYFSSAALYDAMFDLEDSASPAQLKKPELEALHNAIKELPVLESAMALDAVFGDMPLDVFKSSFLTEFGVLFRLCDFLRGFPEGRDELSVAFLDSNSPENEIREGYDSLIGFPNPFPADDLPNLKSEITFPFKFRTGIS